MVHRAVELIFYASIHQQASSIQFHIKACFSSGGTPVEWLQSVWFMQLVLAGQKHSEGFEDTRGSVAAQEQLSATQKSWATNGAHHK